jgi:hypothetical protein
LKLCLLDANVIIYLHQLGLWKMMAERFELFIASTVRAEAMHWLDTDGAEHPIILDPKDFVEVSVGIAESARLRHKFPGLQIDAGELESLAWLLGGKADEACELCSSDAVVFKVLGALGETYRGISLEELLGSVGDRRRLGPQYTRAFSERYAAQGMGLMPRGS